MREQDKIHIYILSVFAALAFGLWLGATISSVTVVINYPVESVPEADVTVTLETQTEVDRMLNKAAIQRHAELLGIDIDLDLD